MVKKEINKIVKAATKPITKTLDKFEGIFKKIEKVFENIFEEIKEIFDKIKGLADVVQGIMLVFKGLGELLVSILSPFEGKGIFSSIPGLRIPVCFLNPFFVLAYMVVPKIKRLIRESLMPATYPIREARLQLARARNPRKWNDSVKDKKWRELGIPI